MLDDRDATQFTIENIAGPLLDDVTPYSGLVSTELKLISEIIFPDWDTKLQPIPESVADRPYWQYGSGEHSSEAMKVLGSVVFQAQTDQGDVVKSRHLVIEGSSQWILEET